MSRPSSPTSNNNDKEMIRPGESTRTTGNSKGRISPGRPFTPIILPEKIIKKYLENSKHLNSLLEELKDKPITFNKENEDGAEEEKVSIRLLKGGNYSITIDGEEEFISFSSKEGALFSHSEESSYQTSDSDLARIFSTLIKAITELPSRDGNDVETETDSNFVTPEDVDLSFGYGDSYLGGEDQSDDGFNSQNSGDNPYPNQQKLRTKVLGTRINWLNYYAKSLFERGGEEDLYVDGSDIKVIVEKVEKGIRINIGGTNYLLSETQLTLFDRKTSPLKIQSLAIDEMMARGRLQELSKAATHFSTLSRLSKISGNEAPRLGKTDIFDNFEHHNDLLKSIAEASTAKELTQVINRAIVRIGSPGTNVETMNDGELSTAIREIKSTNPVVSALRDILRADLTSSELADEDFEEYKTTFVAPYTESHLVVTIEDGSAIVHIITHAEISKFTIDLSNQNEEQKSSIINFIGNKIRGVDTDTTLDGTLTEYLQEQLAEKLKNPQSIELQPDPILEDLEKDFAALEKNTGKLQKIVRGGLLRQVQTQEAKLKAAFEDAAFDVFGTIYEQKANETTESYEGLEIFKKDGKLEVKQPTEMRDAYKKLLASPANSDRLKIFKESEALRTEPGKFSFVGNRLFLETVNEGSRGNSDTRKDKFRILKKHELEDEVEILKLFLDTQRAKELGKFEEALNVFFTPESVAAKNPKLKEEYSDFVELAETTDGDIKLKRKGTTFITYAANRNTVSAEENSPVIYPDSTIHDIQKATEALGEIKAAVKIGNLFKMAHVLSPYGEIVIEEIIDLEELSLTSKITEDATPTTYSVNIGDQIYYISEEVLLDNEKNIVKEPRIIEELKTYLEAAITQVTRAQAEFKTVVESVFSDITEAADYSPLNSEIKLFRKIGAANDEDEASFEATLPISENTLQSYYFKSGGVVRSGNNEEAPPVKFADLVSQKHVAEEFIEAEKAARLKAINQMAGQLILRISQDEVGNFETKLEEDTGLKITANHTTTFKNKIKDIEFIFNQEGSPPQPFLTTNGYESTLHDLQLAQERLDEIYREAAVITLYNTLEAVSEDIFGDSKANGKYPDKNPESFTSREQNGRRTFFFQPSPNEYRQTFTFIDGKLEETDPKIPTETLYETSDRLTVFALEQSSLNAKKLRNTLAEITRQEEDGTYINEDYIEVNVTQKVVQEVKLRNAPEIPLLSCKFTDVNIQGSTFVEAGIGLGFPQDFVKNAPLHLIIEAQKLADQIANEIAKQRAKKRFEDAIHQMVDERTDPEVEGSIHSYRDDNYEYEDLGNGVLTFTDFVFDTSGIKSTYNKLNSPTLSHNVVNDISVIEIEKELITQELNKFSKIIEQEVATKRANLNSEIASNLESMFIDNNHEVETEDQTILREEDGDDSVKFTITDKASGKQKVFKLDEHDNVLIDDKQPSIARLDDLLKEIQKSNTKDLYKKAEALVPYGRIDFTYNNGSDDVNSSLTVEKLAAEEGESAPLAVIISEGDQRYYLEENGLFESDEENTKGEKITDPQITQPIKAQLDLAAKALIAQQNQLRIIVGGVFRDTAPADSTYSSVTFYEHPYIPFTKLNDGLRIDFDDGRTFETSVFGIKIKSQSDEPYSEATFLQLREACKKTSTLINNEKAIRVDSIGKIRNALVEDSDLKIIAEANGVKFGTGNPISVKFNSDRDAGELQFYFKSNGNLLTDPHTTESSTRTSYNLAKLHDHQTAEHALEAILLKAQLLSELRKASNDFLGSGEIGKYTRDGAIFSKDNISDEFEFGIQPPTKKIKFENSKLVEPNDINNEDLIKTLDELSTLRESAQVYEFQRLKEQYDALIDGNEKYLDIEDGKISIKENGHKLTIPPAVTCRFQDENHEKIAEVSIEGTTIKDSQSICDILKAQEALEKLQQHIEIIKQKEAADRKKRSRATSFKTTFHAIAPKTVALAELAKVSQDEIPQNKLMHALDKLFETYELIPTEKSKKFDKADKSTLVKHSLEILKRVPALDQNTIERLSHYQPKSHNRQLNEELEEKAITILRDYYKTQQSEKNEMIAKIQNFALTQKDFARGIHDETSSLRPTGNLSPKYAQLLQEHKELTSSSRGGGGQG